MACDHEVPLVRGWAGEGCWVGAVLAKEEADHGSAAAGRDRDRAAGKRRGCVDRRTAALGDYGESHRDAAAAVAAASKKAC